MEREILKVPATISKIMTMADKGLRLFVDTQEIIPEDAGKVMLLKDKLGWFVFAEQVEINDVKDLPKIESEDDPKTPSERLRARMYVYFTDKDRGLGKPKSQFNEWYRMALDKIGLTYLDLSLIHI